MKGFKLSKTSWLILSTGVFIVALAGLGLTRAEQVQEQSRVTDELTVSAATLEKLQTAELRQRIEELQVKLEENKTLVKQAQERLRQTVVSVDVLDEFYRIAAFYDITLNTVTNSRVVAEKYGGVDFSVTAISASVTGIQKDIIDFVISLNKGFKTGYVTSVQLSIEGEDLEAPVPDEEVPEEEEVDPGEEVIPGDAEEEVPVDETEQEALTQGTINIVIYSL